MHALGVVTYIQLMWNSVRIYGRNLRRHPRQCLLRNGLHRRLGLTVQARIWTAWSKRSLEHQFEHQPTFDKTLVKLEEALD